MAEQNIKGKWKLRAPKNIPKSSTPMIGMVYEGVSKFFGSRVVGVLLNIYNENDEVVLKTRENKLVSVDKKSIKIVAQEE